MIAGFTNQSEVLLFITVYSLVLSIYGTSVKTFVCEKCSIDDVKLSKMNQFRIYFNAKCDSNFKVKILKLIQRLIGLT